MDDTFAENTWLPTLLFCVNLLILKLILRWYDLPTKTAHILIFVKIIHKAVLGYVTLRCAYIVIRITK